MKKKKIIVATVVVLVNLIIVHFIYLFIPFPVGRDYYYEYSIEIINSNPQCEIIIPIPMTENGKVLKYLNYSEEGIDLNDVIETKYGPGLKLEINGSRSYHLEGEYFASKRLIGYYGDGIPVLSMSTLNHTYRRFPPPQSLMIYCSDDEVSIKLNFRAMNSKMKSWSFYRYHIQGGGGNMFITEADLVKDWDHYPIDVSYINVD